MPSPSQIGHLELLNKTQKTEPFLFLSRRMEWAEIPNGEVYFPLILTKTTGGEPSGSPRLGYFLQGL
jgi:hypothetical protein